MVTTWVRNCSWTTAGAWGAGATAVLTVAAITGSDATAGTVIAALSNGVMLFCLVGGLSVLDNVRSLCPDDASRSLLRRHSLLAAVPAVATLVALLPLRLAAIAADVPGPWDGMADSILDITVRATIVWVVLGVVGTVMLRRAR